MRRLADPPARRRFYDLAERKDLIPRGLRQMARWEWWVDHVAAVHRAYSREPG